MTVFFNWQTSNWSFNLGLNYCSMVFHEIPSEPHSYGGRGSQQSPYRNSRRVNKMLYPCFFIIPVKLPYTNPIQRSLWKLLVPNWLLIWQISPFGPMFFVLEPYFYFQFFSLNKKLMYFLNKIVALRFPRGILLQHKFL